MRAFIAVAVAVVLCAGLVSAESTRVFRRDAADVSMMQEAVDTLSEEINIQGRQVWLANTVVDTVASFDQVSAVQNQVQQLVEQSIRFADADDIAGLTDAVTEAASRAQALRVEAISFGAQVPALQSTARRVLSSSVYQHANYYDDLIATTESLESRFRTMQSAGKVIRDGIVANVDSYDANIERLNDTLPDAIEYYNRIQSEVDALSQVDFPALMSRMAQVTATSNTLARWWWTTWFTYSRYQGWYAGNNVEGFGGVNPSNWGDNSYRADHMSQDMNILRSLFTKRGSGGPNAMIWANEWRHYSSTTSQHTGLVFRIRNNNSGATTWRPYFYYTSYGSYDESASITLNGANVWSTTGNCWASCDTSVGISIPPRSISTVIFVFGSGYPYNTRNTVMAFYNSCLNLPGGLEWVDDFSVATELNSPLF